METLYQKIKGSSELMVVNRRTGKKFCVEEIETQPDTEQFSKGYEQGLEYGKRQTDERQFVDVLTLFQDKNGGYTIYSPELPNLITEVEEIKDVPKRLSEAFEVMLEYMIANKKYKIILPPPENKPQK